MNRQELLQISTSLLTAELTAARVTGRLESDEPWRGAETTEGELAKRAVALAAELIQEVDRRAPPSGQLPFSHGTFLIPT